MPVHADAVPGSMRCAGQAVVLAPAPALVKLSHRLVHCPSCNADLRRLEGEFLAPLDRIPNLFLTGRGFAEYPGSGDVRLVSVNRTATIDEHDRSLAYCLRLDRTMRIGARVVEQ